MARRSTRPRRFQTEAGFRAVIGLRTLLLSHRDDFVRTFTEKLLAYAVGRGIEYYDLPAVRRITKEAASDDHRWSSLIMGIVRSTPFSMSSSEAAPQAGKKQDGRGAPSLQ